LFTLSIYMYILLSSLIRLPPHSTPFPSTPLFRSGHAPPMAPRSSAVTGMSVRLLALRRTVAAVVATRRPPAATELACLPRTHFRTLSLRLPHSPATKALATALSKFGGCSTQLFWPRWEPKRETRLQFENSTA